ncbi:MAG: hypothetical protein GY853_15150, partial [PVC group bacterium]|nr:hypothetical protein [PVC group bacterium]
LGVRLQHKKALDLDLEFCTEVLDEDGGMEEWRNPTSEEKEEIVHKLED